MSFALFVVALAIALGANGWIAWKTAPRIYERLEDVPARSVVIVPGARVSPNGEPSQALSDRLECARRLHEAGRVQRILVSGDHGAPEYDETHAMLTWLVDRGVPFDDIVLDHAGFRTLDTMVRARRVFGVTDAVVCTHRFHLARSVFLALDAGIDAVGQVADRVDDPHALHNAAREALARTRAVLDVYVLHTTPHHVGDSISWTGDVRRTWDRWTPHWLGGAR